MNKLGKHSPAKEKKRTEVSKEPGFTGMVTWEHTLLLRRSLPGKDAEGVSAFLRMNTYGACVGQGPGGWGKADRTVWMVEEP